MMHSYQFSAIAAIALGIVELVTATFIFLSLSAGMIAVALIEFLADDFSFNRDLLIFVLTSLVFVILLRRIFGRKNDQNKLAGEDINQY